MNEYILPKSQFIPVVSQSGKLRFRFDPLRGLIEIQDRGVKEIFDLVVIAEKAIMQTNEQVKTVL